MWQITVTFGRITMDLPTTNKTTMQPFPTTTHTISLDRKRACTWTYVSCRLLTGGCLIYRTPDVFAIELLQVLAPVNISPWLSTTLYLVQTCIFLHTPLSRTSVYLSRASIKLMEATVRSTVHLSKRSPRYKYLESEVLTFHTRVDPG